MSTLPEISVVLSTYKRNYGNELCPNFLKCAIQSILSQTFAAFELLLIDDGSQDGTENVCKEYAKNDARIRYIRFDQNSQLPALRYNQGIALAKGKWVAFMFDDDEWLPNALENLYRAASSLPPIYGMVNGLIQFNRIQDGRIVAKEEFGSESSSFRKLVFSNRLGNNSVLVKREIFDFVGGYDENPSMKRICDWDLWIRIALRYKTAVIPKVVAIVNEGLPDSLIHTAVLNTHSVYIRQLLFFRKQPLRKYFFPAGREQWQHFLGVLPLMGIFFFFRYFHLWARRGARACIRAIKKPKLSRICIRAIKKSKLYRKYH